jgi:preprotein translocase subunit SecG
MFGAKGPTSFLAKATLTIGFLFVVNTLTLGYVYNQSSSTSILDGKVITDKNTIKVPSTSSDAPSAPSMPKKDK